MPAATLPGKTGGGASSHPDALAVKLDSKLREWKPEPAEEVRALLNEIMGLADDDSLNLVRSRAVEEEVLGSSVPHDALLKVKRALGFAMEL